MLVFGDRSSVLFLPYDFKRSFFIWRLLWSLPSPISATRRTSVSRRGRIEELKEIRMSKERGDGKGPDGKKERKGASGKVEKDGRRPTEPFKVPRRQQRASNELIKLSNSFGLASERANKCSPLPRGPLQYSRAPSVELWAKFMHVPQLPPILDEKPRDAQLICKEKILYFNVSIGAWLTKFYN